LCIDGFQMRILLEKRQNIIDSEILVCGIEAGVDFGYELKVGFFINGPAKRRKILGVFVVANVIPGRTPMDEWRDVLTF